MDQYGIEIKVLDGKGTVPKLAPAWATKAYDLECRKTRNKLELAYVEAVKQYTKNGELNLAREAQRELGDLKKYGSVPTTADRWTPLFNGKDLKGWRSVKVRNRDPKWDVVDGILIGSGAPGYLVTEKANFTEYRFRVETKRPVDGNTGQLVQFRGPDNFFEAEIFADATDSIIMSRAIGQFEGKKLVTNSPGKEDVQFVQEMQVAKGAINVSIDDVRVASYRNPAEIRGPGAVGVQLWAGASGMTRPVVFRRIEIQEIKE